MPYLRWDSMCRMQCSSGGSRCRLCRMYISPRVRLHMQRGADTAGSTTGSCSNQGHGRFDWVDELSDCVRDDSHPERRKLDLIACQRR